MENQQLELKEIWHDEYLKWICGFANAQGGVLENIKRTIENNIKQLKDKGLIKRIGSRKTGYWQVLQH